MKKVYNWLKKDDNFWLVLIILSILAVFIGVVFFWDWIWDHFGGFIILYLIFFWGGDAGYQAWRKIHGYK